MHCTGSRGIERHRYLAEHTKIRLDLSLAVASIDVSRSSGAKLASARIVLEGPEKERLEASTLAKLFPRCCLENWATPLGYEFSVLRPLKT